MTPFEPTRTPRPRWRLLALTLGALTATLMGCSSATGGAADAQVDGQSGIRFQDVGTTRDAGPLPDGASDLDAEIGSRPATDAIEPSPDVPAGEPDVPDGELAGPAADVAAAKPELPEPEVQVSDALVADSTLVDTSGPEPELPEPDLPTPEPDLPEPNVTAPDPCEADPSISAGAPCDGDDLDLCADGIWICTPGGLVCGDSPESDVEICNDLDDDCDDLIDEDFLDKGAACDGPDGDTCADGVWVCGSGDVPLACDEEPAPDPDCDDGDPCTMDTLTGDAKSCSLQCVHTPLPGCCGNGILEDGEACDGDDCPTTCDDGNPCTDDLLVGSAEGCDAQCVHSLGEDPGTNADGDALSDCDELLDDLESTDWQVFNGLTAIVGEAPSGFFTSAQCDLFFGDDWGQMLELFDESGQTQDVWSGWEYSASSSDYASTTEYDFEPPFTESSQVGIWSSFQLLFAGTIFLEGDGFHCFSVDTDSGGVGPGDIAGRRNCCGRVYIDPDASSLPLAETGYGAGASPVTGCINASAGPHTIGIASRHYETYTYDPRLKVRYCFGGPEACVPAQALEAEQLQAQTASPLF